MSADQGIGVASLFDGPPAAQAIAVPVSERKEVRVYLAEHKGIAHVHVREFWRDWRTGKMSPTNSGAAMPYERLGVLIQALEQLLARELA